MTVKNFSVEPISYLVARKFIEKWHYSHNTNGIKVYKCFGIFTTSALGLPELIGAMIYGKPAMNHQAQKWSPNNPEKCVELRRLACTDDAPKNTESFFISKTLKWLKKNTDVEVIISYADSNYGHVGTIYKASNFIHAGETSPGVILIVDGKRYHDRTLRMKKPYALKIRERVKNNDPNIQFVKTLPKHIYVYYLRSFNGATPKNT